LTVELEKDAKTGLKNEKTILLVEDNPDDEALALRALRKNNIGADVIVARDGVEALASLRVEPEAGPSEGPPSSLPEMVLLDLKLPKVDGLEVLRRIRAHERTRRLPVVVLTSSLEPQDMARAYDLHANSYIRKPVDFSEFMEAVRQIGTYWLELNQLPSQQPR